MWIGRAKRILRALPCRGLGILPVGRRIRGYIRSVRAGILGGGYTVGIAKGGNLCRSGGLRTGVGVGERRDRDAGLARLAGLTWQRGGQLAAIGIHQRHLLQIGVFGAANNLAGGIDVDETPVAVGGIGGILVGLAEEMDLGHAFFEVVERLRVVAGLVIVEANGAGVLIAAPDGLLFDAATADGRAFLQDDETGGDHEEDQA